MIRFACPTCRAALKVPPKLSGKSAPCPRCDDKIKIPLESEVDDRPAPRPAPTAARTFPRPKTKPPVDDDILEDGFEIVDDEPANPGPPARRSVPPTSKTKPVVEDDFEVIDDPNEPKPRPKFKGVRTGRDRDDEGAYDERPVRRKKKFKKKRRTGSGSTMQDMEADDGAYLKYLGISCGIVAVFGGLMCVNIAFGIPLYLMMFVMGIYNLIWTIMICNREGGGVAVLLIFLPFGYLINLVRFWNPMWKPFAQSMATGFIFYGFLFVALLPMLKERADIMRNQNELNKQQVNPPQPNPFGKR